MIVFNLICSHQHAFEGWFASADTFERQLEQGLVACPNCGDQQVTRLPSGPHVVTSHGAKPPSGRTPVARSVPVPDESVPVAELGKLLDGLRQVLETSEDVGEDFPDEARRIHHHESPSRNIRGVATIGDALELMEEGVPVLPLSLVSKKDLH